MSEKASKGRFLKPDKLQTDYSNEEKGKEKEKEQGEEKKAMAAPIVFTIATFEFLAEKKFWTQNFKGPFGDNVSINLARYIF